MGKLCLCCGEFFCPYPGRPHQEFCSKAGCQRERRRRWHREKMANDEVYRKGQSDCQHNWLERHPDYWQLVVTGDGPVAIFSACGSQVHGCRNTIE
ncbi:MAG: hypothetical protein U5J62_08015 [Desulfurivibrio sp.]|nr:hypothetical protein [Desulfurivibrio sp.]